MKAHEVKQLMKGWFRELGLPSYKLTARTISFQDLARGESVFIRIHQWQPNPNADEIKKRAHAAGFCVEFR